LAAAKNVHQLVRERGSPYAAAAPLALGIAAGLVT
jgi:hypothetical protein